jgi:predicted PurR-regulated permease PerM
MKPPQSISISTSTFIKAVLIVLGLWFLWFVRDIIAILVAALLLTALIDPFADWFANRKIPRSLAVLIVYTVLGALTSIILLLMIPIVSEQGVNLLSNLSTYYKDATASFGEMHQFSTGFVFSEYIAFVLQGIEQIVHTWSTGIFSTVTSFIGGAAALLIVLVLTFYMVADEDGFKSSVQYLVPVEYQPYTKLLLKKLKRKMGAWLRGQLILSLIIGVSVYVGLSILGIKYALLLALIAGMLEIIPYAGPILSLIPALIVGFAISPMHGISILILYIVIQQIENHVLVPKVMQKVTGLHPVLSIVALLIGLKVAGVLGAIFAIPLTMMIVVILEDLFKDVS